MYSPCQHFVDLKIVFEIKTKIPRLKNCFSLSISSNIPKFLAPDIPLFEAILRDLFPGVVVPKVDYGTVQVKLETDCLDFDLLTTLV